MSASRLSDRRGPCRSARRSRTRSPSRTPARRRPPTSGSPTRCREGTAVRERDDVRGLVPARERHAASARLAALESGAGATIVLTVRPTVGGAHTNQAVVSADQADPMATNNTALSNRIDRPVRDRCVHDRLLLRSDELHCRPGRPGFGGEKGDFNGDGVVDVIFGPVGVNTVGIMLGNGAGGFGPPSLIPIPGTPNGVAVADYNNDGHQDVVISSERTAEAWVLLGNGLGRFGARGHRRAADRTSERSGGRFQPRRQRRPGARGRRPVRS